jgi:hypothetical protein
MGSSRATWLRPSSRHRVRTVRHANQPSKVLAVSVRAYGSDGSVSSCDECTSRARSLRRHECESESAWVLHRRPLIWPCDALHVSKGQNLEIASSLYPRATGAGTVRAPVGWAEAVMWARRDSRRTRVGTAAFISDRHLISASHCCANDGPVSVKLSAPTWENGASHTSSGAGEAFGEQHVARHLPHRSG